MTARADTLLDLLATTPVLPVMTITEVADAVPAASALVEGGCRILEVLLRSEAAFDAVRRIREELPEVVVGIGTVRTPADLERAAGAGARFAVSPGVTPNLAGKARAFPLWFMPGVATPSEAMTAMEEGFSLLKLFPAGQLGGPEVVRAIAGPLPTAKFCPSGGVNADDLGKYLALENVVCVSGSWLAPPSAIREHAWPQITSRTRDAFMRARAIGWSPGART